jgi:hypothetical protein
MDNSLRDHLLRLALVEGAVVLIGVAVLLVVIAFGYNGTCGSILPFISAQDQPCSWLEYMGQMLLIVGGFGLLSLLTWRGLLLVLVVLLVPAGCYLLVGRHSLWLAVALAVGVLALLAIVAWLLGRGVPSQV